MLTYYLLQFVEGVAVYLIITTLCGLKNKISFLKFLSLSVLHALTYYIIAQIFPYAVQGISFTISTIFICNLLLNVDFALSTFSSLIAITIKVILEALFVIFCISVLKISIDEFHVFGFTRVIATLINQLFYLLIASIVYIKNMSIRNKIYLNKKTNILVSSVFSITSILAMFLIVLNIYITAYQPIVYIFFIITFSSLVFTIYRLNKYFVSMAVEETQLEEQKIYIEYIKELVSHLKCQRHEFINHINVLYGLVQVKDINRLETAKDYIENLNITIQGTSNIMATDEPVVSGLLFTKIAIAEQKNIEFDVHINDRITDTNLSLTEISTVLNNLINNAIEFLEEIPEEKRYIFFEITGDNDNIYVDICNENDNNPIPDKNIIFTKGYSTKNNERALRGFGLYNVKNIIEKHKGSIVVESDDQETRFKVTLPKKKAL
ncbi:MAG: GHKL domain-containing protein [Epulopiscium sp.]|nr:GHKL domain-containing protein [Candidatus Epulonipiscium sp.]